MNVMPELDEKVREFVGENLDREGVVTGWVLCVATAYFDEDGDAVYAHDYSVGPDTDLLRAVGLMDLAHRRMLRDCGVDGDS